MFRERNIGSRIGDRSVTNLNYRVVYDCNQGLLYSQGLYKAEIRRGDAHLVDLK